MASMGLLCRLDRGRICARRMAATADVALRPLFEGRVLALTEDVIVRWKSLVVDGQKRGHTFGQPDLFIASIAALESLVVVSRDIGEFVAAGVPMFDDGRQNFGSRHARRFDEGSTAETMTTRELWRSLL
jgi:hypothetical protein